MLVGSVAVAHLHPLHEGSVVLCWNRLRDVVSRSHQSLQLRLCFFLCFSFHWSGFVWLLSGPVTVVCEVVREVVQISIWWCKDYAAVDKVVEDLKKVLSQNCEPEIRSTTRVFYEWNVSFL